MSARLPFPGIQHGDKVRLTGVSWPQVLAGKVFTVDDESHHRPVIVEESMGHDFLWYIMKDSGADFSAVKVAE